MGNQSTTQSLLAIDRPSKKPDNQPEDDSDQRKAGDPSKRKELTMILKIMNILLGLALISFVIYCYFGVDKSAIENTVLGIIIPAYIGLSGCIIILVECRLEIVCRNMKFLYNYIGRGIFNFYVGVMPLALIPEYPITDSAKLFKILTIVLASLTCLVGLLYILAKILCCAKEAQRKTVPQETKSSEHKRSQVKAKQSNSDE